MIKDKHCPPFRAVFSEQFHIRAKLVRMFFITFAGVLYPIGKNVSCNDDFAGLALI